MLFFYAISRKSQDQSVHFDLLFAMRKINMTPQCTLFFFMQFLEKHKTHLLFATPRKLHDLSVHVRLFVQLLFALSRNYETPQSTWVFCLQCLEK